MAQVVHHIKGNDYLYDHHREGDKVVADYIGPIDSGGKLRAVKHSGGSSGQVTQQHNENDKIKTAIYSIKDLTTEKSLIYDSNTHELLGESTGKEGYVRTDESLFKSLKGNIFIHNHPENSSFSYADFNLAGHGKLKKMIAVTDNYVYTLDVTTTPGIISLIDINRDMSKKHIRLELEYKKKYENLNWEDITHKINESFAMDIEGIEYKREPIKSYTT